MLPARSNVFRQQFGILSTFSVLVVQPALGVFARATLTTFRSLQESKYLFRFQSQRQPFQLQDGWLCNRQSKRCCWLVVGFLLMKFLLGAEIIRVVYWCCCLWTLCPLTFSFTTFLVMKHLPSCLEGLRALKTQHALWRWPLHDIADYKVWTESKFGV